MRNRDYKEFAKNEIYHIYNRGVGKMNIFLDNKDHQMFLSRLEENLFPERIDKSEFSWNEKRRKILPSNSFNLICYCLMPNHFHLLIQQKTDLSITKLISKLCTSYSIYFNKKYNRVGAVLQDQFKAVLIKSNEQLLWTSFYIHKNPIEAGLVSNVYDYKWNSYLEYVNSMIEPLCKKDILLEQFKSKDSFVSYFQKSLVSKDTDYKLVGFQDLLIDNLD